ncbi:IS701 family transposase [Streptomyces hoynatensis]|uniref:IS701 family transposase n=1 Tax=Streptomyces hoynatensis TaxID=1141874 RepID=UPI00131A138A|nr:transposase [Streptomyces hoynatensis]
MPVSAIRESSIHHIEFEEFTKATFSSLLRADQKRWAAVYLRGLLSVKGRKAIRKMVSDHPESSRLAAVQSLQQFINQSPWDWNPVRESLARIVYDQITPKAWVINEATIPKRGIHSVGVARRFVELEGRTINCQLGLGLFLATEYGALPVDWCLALGDEWINERERRERTRVPEHIDRQSPSDHVLEMTDRLVCDWRLPLAPVVANACYNSMDAVRLISGFTERNIDFLLEVPAFLEAVAHPYLTRVRTDVPPACNGVPREPTTVQEACIALGGAPQRATVVPVGHRRRSLSVRSSYIRIPGIRIPGHCNVPTYRLYAELSPVEGRPTRFWITNLLHRRIDEMVDLALLHRQSLGDLSEMQESFGLRDFEGRSYPGWHHHMTLVSVAYGYHRLVSESDQLIALAGSL